MIERKDLFHIPFYKKESFKGSHKNMCYKISKETKENNDILLLYTWEGPFCFDKTDDNNKISKEFEFSEKGLDDICEWLNSLV